MSDERDQVRAVVRARREAGMLGSMVAEVAERDRPPIRSYATGMPDLDKLLGGGISTRALTSVLGPPGNGKSQWCVALAVKLSPVLPTLYISTELEADELAARIAAVVLGDPWRDIVRGRVDRARVRAALASLRIRVVGCDEVPRDGTFAAAVTATIAAMVEEFGVPPLVVVDYTQDLARGSDEKSIRAKVGDIATALRALAQECDCPLIAVSSVARSFYSEKRRDDMRALKDPTAYLSAAKESGDVDYASAAVLFLDVEPAGDTPHRLAQIAVAKSRHGETGFAGARFYGASGRWESDSTAVEALTDDRRSEQKQRAIEVKEEGKVLTVVRRLHAKGIDPITGFSGLKNKTTLSEGCGMNKQHALRAISRLLEAGVLVDRTEGLVNTRKVIDLAPDSSGLIDGSRR